MLARGLVAARVLARVRRLGHDIVSCDVMPYAESLGGIGVEVVLVLAMMRQD
jgi:hypothetical protein